MIASDHTADDTLDKIDPKQLDQAVAVWSAFTYLAAASVRALFPLRLQAAGSHPRWPDK